jgi:uncharacterized membrane protein YdjX (TVP38/TMEM64 family)
MRFKEDNVEPPPAVDSPTMAAAAPGHRHHLSEMAELLGAHPDMADRAEYLFFFTATTVFILGGLLWLGYIYLDPVRERLYQLILDKERIRAVMNQAGSWGPVLFIVLQGLQVVTIFWPVPLEIAGGFLFGLPLGFVYSTLGLALGSMTAFLLGRWLERKLVTRLMHPKKMKTVRRLLSREGTLTAFLIFLIPGVPKDFVCYFMGLTRISLGFFLVAATLARLPGVLLFTLEGAEVYQGHYGVTLGLVTLYLGLAYYLYRHREALYRWVERWQPAENHDEAGNHNLQSRPA